MSELINVTPALDVSYTFMGVLSFITRVFDHDLDSLSHFYFSIIDSRFQPVGLSTHWLYS